MKNIKSYSEYTSNNVSESFFGSKKPQLDSEILSKISKFFSIISELLIKNKEKIKYKFKERIGSDENYKEYFLNDKFDKLNFDDNTLIDIFNNEFIKKRMYYFLSDLIYDIDHINYMNKAHENLYVKPIAGIGELEIDTRELNNKIDKFILFLINNLDKIEKNFIDYFKNNQDTSALRLLTLIDFDDNISELIDIDNFVSGIAQLLIAIVHTLNYDNFIKNIKNNK